MSTTDVAPDEHHVGEHEEHLADGSYVLIALILGLITLVEVSTYFFDYGGFAVPMLLVLMVIKFAVVVAYFMHLRFDNKLFTYLFVMGIALAVGVYLVVLTMFHFWLDG